MFHQRNKYMHKKIRDSCWISNPLWCWFALLVHKLCLCLIVYWYIENTYHFTKVWLPTLKKINYYHYLYVYACMYLSMFMCVCVLWHTLCLSEDNFQVISFYHEWGLNSGDHLGWQVLYPISHLPAPIKYKIRCQGLYLLQMENLLKENPLAISQNMKFPIAVKVSLFLQMQWPSCFLSLLSIEELGELLTDRERSNDSFFLPDIERW